MGEQTEAALLDIWRTVFERADIGPEDDFFVLGGFSLLAAQIIEQVEALWGLRLPISAVFLAPTVRELAALIEAQLADQQEELLSSAALIPIRSAGTRPPLFCMHDIGGGVFNYRPLALRLGSDQPVYGIAGYGMRGDEQPLTSVGAMAQYCLRVMREFQPHGPYFLAGHSFAGVVAYEVARQLEAAGEQVGLLALFDSWLPYDPRQPRWVTVLRWRYLLLRKRARRQARQLLQPGAPGLPVGAGVTADDLPRVRAFKLACARAMADYRLRRYGGRLVYFASRWPGGPLKIDHHAGWAHLARGGADVQRIPSDHVAMMAEPYVGVVAEIIGEYISRANGVAGGQLAGVGA